MNYKISPSDLAFLYEGCHRCYYLKVKDGIIQPSIPLPSIFSKIAGLLKNHYSGKNTKELHASIPPGTVILGEKYVKSDIIRAANCADTCYISGRFDIVIKFDDGTYGVVDFKTGSPNEEYVQLYSRQLHAYAYALEHPAAGALSLSPVTRLGLFYFYPNHISQTGIENLAYEAAITWIDVKKDEPGFINFMGNVLEVLAKPVAPSCSPDCQWCNYSQKLAHMAF